MDKKSLIKSLLLSFLPLLIFVAADEYLADHYPEHVATQYALMLGIGMGVVQAIYVFVMEKRLDKLILLDTGLIVVLGSVSLISGNELFFKIKPALIQFIMVIGLGFMAFLKPQMLHAMSGRFLQGSEVGDAQLKAMQRSAQIMVIVLFLHTLLIVYAALSLSKGAWAFIAGPLIYIVAAIYFVVFIGVQYWRRRSTRRD